MHGSLGNREEHEGVDRSQETCLFVKTLYLRVTDSFSDSMHNPPPSDGALRHGSIQKQPQETAVFIILKQEGERTMKKWIGILMAVAMMTALCACGTEQPATETASAGDENGADTAILVVSFGTSYNESRDLTIGAIEKAIAAAYPQYEVRRAFTSQIIIDKLKERDGLEIDNVDEALTRAAADGIRNLIVQPTHLMNGFEYTDLKEALDEYSDQFDQIVLGEPLLTSDEDFEAVITAVTDASSSNDDGNTALVFMGHGTEAESNAVYTALQEKLSADGFGNYYIGTVEADPTVEDIVAAIQDKGYTRVVLQPLMIVAGDHANNDMAGDEDDSWKNVFKSNGYEVECVLEGLGQNEAVQQIFVDHVAAAIAQLK